MKTLLCVPPQGYFAERWQDSGMPALGPLYMAAVLEQKGKPVEILPANILKMTVPETARHIADSGAGLAGVSVTTENRLEAFDLCREIKKIKPEITVMAGGPHCTYADIDTLAHIPEIDIVARGESEYTTPELIDCLESKGDLGKVLGITWRDKDGNIHQNNPRPHIPDLNVLPMPARHLDDLKKYNFIIDVPGRGKLQGVNMMTSRGCPFNCNFCATPHNWGRKVRGFSAENVIKEIEFLIETYGAQAFWFFDDTFNYNPQRLEQICRTIIERKYNISWWCEIRVDIINKPLFELMVEAGLFHVGFGVESACRRVATDIIHKKATISQALDVIDWSNELGITPNPFFIFSHPTETYDEALETLQFAQALEGRVQCSLSVLHVYPGTELCRTAEAEGKIPKDFSWTTPNDPRILELPEAQGHVPLYLDKLTWFQISSMIFMFNDSAKRISLSAKIQKAVKNCKSWRQFKVYFVMGLAFLHLKLKRMLGIKLYEKVEFDPEIQARLDRYKREPKQL